MLVLLEERAKFGLSVPDIPAIKSRELIWLSIGFSLLNGI